MYHAEILGQMWGETQWEKRTEESMKQQNLFFSREQLDVEDWDVLELKFQIFLGTMK